MNPAGSPINRAALMDSVDIFRVEKIAEKVSSLPDKSSFPA
jgi:hypothetical protein